MAIRKPTAIVDAQDGLTTEESYEYPHPVEQNRTHR